MFRTTVIGTVCLALICLGSGITYREVQAQDGEVDLIVIEGNVNATEVPAAEKGEVGKALVESDGNLVEIKLGSDAGLGSGGARQQVIIVNEDGKIRETRTVENGPQPSFIFGNLAGGSQVVDPETRTAIDKLIAGLEEEVRKLQAESKAEEAEKKLQSIRALRQLLQVNARATMAQKVRSRIDGNTVEAERQLELARTRATQLGRLAEAERHDGLKRLATRRHELAAEISKVPEQDREQGALLGARIAELDRLLVEERKSLTPPAPGTDSSAYFYRTLTRTAETNNLQRAIEKVAGSRKTLGEQLAQVPEANAEERAKLQAQIADAERTIAELKYRLEERFTKMPLPPGAAPGIRLTAPIDATQPLGVPVLEKVPHIDRLFRVMPPELLPLRQKVQALSQAADALAQAGLEDQARELKGAAEKLQKEIELRRAEMASRADVAAPLGIASLAPHELHRSIRELTEQVQQLRKEVAEVRELLQRRQ